MYIIDNIPMMKLQKFKDHFDRDGKFEPVPSQVIPYNKDDSKVEKVKAKTSPTLPSHQPWNSS